MSSDPRTFEDPRVEKLMHRIRSRSVQALGVLINTDGAAFYTASDVALKLLDAAKIRLDDVSVSDFNYLLSGVSQSLGNSHRKRIDDIRRTSNRIRPRLYTQGKASFGYRIGMALGMPTITVDTLRDHKSNVNTFENVQKHKAELAERLVQIMTYSELTSLEEAIRARKEHLYRSMEEKLLRSHTKASNDLYIQSGEQGNG